MKKLLTMLLVLMMIVPGASLQLALAETATEEAPVAEAVAPETDVEETAEAEETEAVEETAEAEETEETAEAEETEAAEETAEAEEAEEYPPIEYDYDELTVGTITPFDGKFFTEMWGNASSDLDVRMLVHGYNLVEWDVVENGFQVDPSVVSGIVVTQNPAGDRTYTLTLYNDLQYNDGTPITARDYAFSLLLSIAPQITEIGGRVKGLDYLVGYENYINGTTPYLAGVRVLSDNTLSFTVSNEYLPFFYEMALLDCQPSPISVIAPGCRVADDGQGIYIANEDAEAEEPVFTADLLRQTILDPETGYLTHPTLTCGPYNLVSFDGDAAQLEINENYKGNSKGDKPQIQRLIYREVSNDTMVDELSTGEITLLNRCLSADALQAGTQLVGAGRGFTFSNYTRNGMAFISFCCEREAVSSVAVRQAIAMCLDKDNLVTDVVRNYGLRVDGYYGMGQWMYDLVTGTVYPVEEPEAGAAEAAQQAYEEEIAAWEELTLDNAKVYDLDEEAAAALLASDGWTLNREGEAFDPEKDDVRCKALEDGTVLPLELKLVCPEGSAVNGHLESNFAEHLANVGVKLNIEIIPMDELLNLFYRGAERDCDMIFLASNFDIVFDPTINFMPDGETANRYNNTAIDDQQLFELAQSMRQTSPDDKLGYCQKWVAFQERFQELEPMIPIYSNVYFDFYPRVLQDYDISSYVSWGQAVVSAFMSDISDEAEAEEVPGPELPEGMISWQDLQSDEIEIEG